MTGSGNRRQSTPWATSCAAISDIRLILVHPDLGNAAKLAAITESVEVLAMPSASGADRARGSAQSAAVVVALLARNCGPATLLFGELAREQIRIELAARADRPLNAALCQRATTRLAHIRQAALPTA